MNTPGCPTRIANAAMSSPAQAKLSFCNVSDVHACIARVFSEIGFFERESHSATASAADLHGGAEDVHFRKIN